MSQAKDALAEQDFSKADNRFALAYKTFNQGQDQLASSGQLLNQLMSILPQKQSADGLLKAAALVSSAGGDFVDLEGKIKSLHIGLAGISGSSGDSGAQALQDINLEINGISAKITRAANLVNKIDPGVLPAGQRGNFADLKSKLQIAEFSLNNFTSVFQLAQDLLSGDKNVLVLFENNNELRAGGGFIGHLRRI